MLMTFSNLARTESYLIAILYNEDRFLKIQICVYLKTYQFLLVTLPQKKDLLQFQPKNFHVYKQIPTGGIYLDSYYVYTYVTFADCTKNVGLLGKRKSEANIFLSLNTFK